jgi:hypothetical protein
MNAAFHNVKKTSFNRLGVFFLKKKINSQK